MIKQRGIMNDVPARLRAFAKDQRSTMPRAEALFWEQVRAGRLNGHKFKRQVPIAPYIVDFLCIAARLVVELDGPPHESETRRFHDAYRDAFLREQGFRVLRFTNDAFLGNPQCVMDQVLQAVESAKSLPPLAGEGVVRVSGRRERGHVLQHSPCSRPGLTAGPPSPASGGG